MIHPTADDGGAAVQRLMDILDVLQGAAPSISVESVAHATDVPVESVEAYLQNLECRGYGVHSPSTLTYTSRGAAARNDVVPHLQ